MSDNIRFDEQNWMDEPIVFGLNTNANLGLSTPKKPPLPATGPSDQFQTLADVGIGISTFLLQKILSHPCMVLRRQCQVNKSASRYHLTPFTLIPVAFKLAGHQGFGTLFKGGSSVFIVHGLELAVNTAVADVFSLPKEIFLYSRIKHLVQHIALKGVSFALITPFLCSSLVETVQSDIASEKPGILDCLKEGFYRIVQWGKPRTNRMLPIWLLIGPTVVFGVLRYSITTLTHSVSVWFLTLRLQKYSAPNHQTAQPINQTDKLLIEFVSSFVGSFVSDLLLFPVETVLHRLYLQGTRCIIDNLDTGLSVTPVVTNYEGPLDCFRSIVQEEGAAGLYRGFGAMILQYCLQAVILRSTSMFLESFRQFILPNSMATSEKQIIETGEPAKQDLYSKLNLEDY